MFRKSCCVILPLIVVVACTGCNKNLTTTDVQTARMAEAREDPRPHLAHMVDNAMVQDMSVADFHFVGHTSELSGTGAARLDRLAHILGMYGGTVRYETQLTDEELIQQRLSHVQEYLALAGCDMERVDVIAMISGGRGMPARKAIEIEERGTKPPGDEGEGMSLDSLIGK